VLYCDKRLVLTVLCEISHLLFCKMPPPPPPPICFPFIKSKPKRRLSFDSMQPAALSPTNEKNIVRHPAFSPTSTLSSDAASLTFHSDSELYDDIPDHLPMLPKDQSVFPKLSRSTTVTGTKKSTVSSKWGYGWGIGKKNKEKGGDSEINEKSASQVDLPLYQPVVRRDSKSTQASHSTQRSHDTHRTQDSRHTQNTQRTHESHRTHVSQQSKFSQGSKNTYRSNSSRSTAPKPRPPLINGHALYPHDSTDTLVGSAFERKVNEQDSIRIKPDTTERLQDMRRLMIKDKLDY
jgi:Xaa-Pro aminopeptidase